MSNDDHTPEVKLNADGEFNRDVPFVAGETGAKSKRKRGRPLPRSVVSLYMIPYALLACSCYFVLPSTWSPYFGIYNSWQGILIALGITLFYGIAIPLGGRWFWRHWFRYQWQKR